MKYKQLRAIFLFLFFTIVIVSQIIASAVPPKEPEAPSITHHSINLKGKILKYKSEAGYLPMKDEKGQPLASIFFISYSSEEAKKNPARPITFAFNGGPGGAAVFVHLGGIGPKKIMLSSEGSPLPPPYRYIENENTWLDFTDLVFVDPVSTGYSRAAKETDSKKFHGVNEDIQIIGDFIRLFITKYQRWSSPLYLCGCSYAVTRNIGLAGYLQDRHNLFPQGLILMVGFLNSGISDFEVGTDLPYVIQLPTYTAAAWYHKKLSPKYQENLLTTLKEAEEWALSGYLNALVKGDNISEEEREKTIDQLCRYTGLTKDYIDKTDLRILSQDFLYELIKDKKQTVGMYDCRVTADNSKIPFLYSPYDGLSDPSLTAKFGTFSAVFNEYARTQLNYFNDLPYELLNIEVYPWNWGSGRENLRNMSETLHRAIKKNQYLKVMVVNGYYDIRVPYLTNRYAISHLGLPDSLKRNIVFKCYPSGHTLYADPKVSPLLKSDVQDFYLHYLKK